MLADPPLPEDVPDVVPLLTTREVSCCQVEVSPAQVLQRLSDPPTLDSDAVARGDPAHDLLGSVDFAPGEKQVWSLTQFYSLNFSKSRIGVKKVRFLQTHNQGLRQLLLTVSWDLRA